MRDPVGFTRDFSGREAICLGVFGAEGTGKTRFCSTASEWAQENGKTPGWIVCDRKTRKTVRDVCREMEYPLPLINEADFITQSEALAIASTDREKDDEKIKKIYSDVYSRLISAVKTLADDKTVEPVILETGSQLWDWISFAHFGRKQGVGKGRVWGPPKQDWTDLLDALSHKSTIITFWERDEYKGDERLGTTKPDGPPHTGYTTTSIVRMNQDRRMKLKDDQSYVDRFSLDVYESQDNKGLESVDAVLTGADITYKNLIERLRPE